MTAGRLAPSPTGAQHLGNARTYLLAYLSARSSGLPLVLRIEDIDSPRVKPWAIQQAIDDLRWLGIDWDQGPDVGGPHAPYLQTQRRDHYRRALESLIQSDRVYPCTCTRKDIAAAGSAPHFEHEGNRYPGTCSAWRHGQSLPDSKPFCWRFRTGNQPIVFQDLLHGTQRCIPANDLGDFPVTQKNGQPSYQLAVVVDDAEMEITEVVRGDDLLASTFRQIEIFCALGYDVPRFGHVPLVIGTDGRRLAKRHGDTRLSQYRQAGLAPETIIGWASYSVGLKADPSRCQASELIDSFSWEQVAREETVLDHEFG